MTSGWIQEAKLIALLWSATEVEYQEVTAEHERH